MRLRSVLVWSALIITIAIPVVFAISSPLLAWRQPVYIAAGFAGIFGMALMLLQPLLAANLLPGLNVLSARKLHQLLGSMLVVLVTIHVLGLWITSPPDVVDVLLFRSPTPFSVWGVVAMWAIFLTAALAMLRKPLRLSPKTWRAVHSALAAVIVAGTVVHAFLIEGTMETNSKVLLGILVLAATTLGLTKALFRSKRRTKSSV